jgi:exonuclease VII large subunit
MSDTPPTESDAVEAIVESSEAVVNHIERQTKALERAADAAERSARAHELMASGIAYLVHEREEYREENRSRYDKTRSEIRDARWKAFRDMEEGEPK